MAVQYLPPSKTYFFTGTTTERNNNTLAKVPGSRWFDITAKQFYIYGSAGWEIETEYKPCVCDDVVSSGGTLFFIKGFDQSVVGTSLADDDALKCVVAPNEKLAFTLFMAYQATPDTDFAYTITAPSGAQLFYEGVGPDANMNLGQMGALSSGDVTVLIQFALQNLMRQKHKTLLYNYPATYQKRYLLFLTH